MFIGDTSYPEAEKPENWGCVDYQISPRADHPAQMVSWCDSVLFCNWLSIKEGRKPCYQRTGEKDKDHEGKQTTDDAWRVIPGANGYRMFSDSEWEYACRAGTQTKLSTGNDESLLVGYCQMYPSKQTALCGEKMPNAWGLHDVHGNVCEWCEDLYNTDGSSRVSRGGCWYNDAGSLESADRNRNFPANRSGGTGFRLALSPY